MATHVNICSPARINNNFNRITKEVNSYKKEAQQQEEKIQRMKDSGADAYDIKKQVNISKMYFTFELIFFRRKSWLRRRA
jgi:hypothetical protein